MMGSIGTDSSITSKIIWNGLYQFGSSVLQQYAST